MHRYISLQYLNGSFKKARIYKLHNVPFNQMSLFFFLKKNQKPVSSAIERFKADFVS